MNEGIFRVQQDQFQTQILDKFPVITYDIADESSYFYVFVKAGHERIGELKADKVGPHHARLSDIYIKDVWKLRRSWRARLKHDLFQKFNEISFRNAGIGSNLLAALVEWSKRNNVTHLYGSIVQSDLEANPRLLEWYERKGFKIEKPSEDCLRDSIAMVVWENPSLN